MEMFICARTPPIARTYGNVEWKQVDGTRMRPVGDAEDRHTGHIVSTIVGDCIPGEDGTKETLPALGHCIDMYESHSSAGFADVLDSTRIPNSNGNKYSSPAALYAGARRA